MNINEIKELLLVIDKTNLEYVKLENNELKLELSKSKKNLNNNVFEYNTKIINDENINLTIEENKINIKKDQNDYSYVIAPLMGTFYNAPNPDENAFVNVGDIVNQGDTLCIVEAMKLMNEITSDFKGEIVEILVQNEELVEYNQPLIKIKPLL